MATTLGYGGPPHYSIFSIVSHLVIHDDWIFTDIPMTAVASMSHQPCSTEKCDLPRYLRNSLPRPIWHGWSWCCQCRELPGLEAIQFLSQTRRVHWSIHRRCQASRQRHIHLSKEIFIFVTQWSLKLKLVCKAKCQMTFKLYCFYLNFFCLT